MPICLWSGPRNVSTALMYSFAQRTDIRVVDEPLYGHYLRVTGANHPGRDEILAAMNCDGYDVMRGLLAEQSQKDSRRLFVKHMAHHLVDLDQNFLRKTCNIFLIRDPREMLPSLVNQLPDARLADTGLKKQWQLYADLTNAGTAPIILDSRELLLDPAGVLGELCVYLDLIFSTDMLHWKAEARIEDGIWAPYWYHALHRSVGFAAYKQKTNFPAHLKPLLDQCKPWYDKLYERALRAHAKGDSQ